MFNGKILFILVLFFNFQTVTWANDIFDVVFWPGTTMEFNCDGSRSRLKLHIKWKTIDGYYVIEEQSWSSSGQAIKQRKDANIWQFLADTPKFKVNEGSNDFQFLYDLESPIELRFTERKISIERFYRQIKNGILEDGKQLKLSIEDQRVRQSLTVDFVQERFLRSIGFVSSKDLNKSQPKQVSGYLVKSKILGSEKNVESEQEVSITEGSPSFISSIKRTQGDGSFSCQFSEMKLDRTLLNEYVKFNTPNAKIENPIKESSWSTNYDCGTSQILWEQKGDGSKIQKKFVVDDVTLIDGFQDPFYAQFVTSVWYDSSRVPLYKIYGNLSKSKVMKSGQLYYGIFSYQNSIEGSQVVRLFIHPKVKKINTPQLKSVDAQIVEVIEIGPSGVFDFKYHYAINKGLHAKIEKRDGFQWKSCLISTLNFGN